MIIDSYRFGGGGPPPVTGDPFFTNYNFGGSSLRNDFTGPIGCRFSFPFWAGTYSTTIYGLGRWIESGNNQTHEVRLWDAADPDVPVLIEAVNVDTTLFAPGDFGYVPLVTPFVFAVFHNYYLTSWAYSGGDQWWNAGLTADAWGGYGDCKALYNGQGDYSDYHWSLFTEGDPGFVPLNVKQGL